MDVDSVLGEGEIPDLASRIEHTLLNPAATYVDIDRLCDEALQFSFFGVCVHGSHVLRCVEHLAGTLHTVAVVGFPLGAAHSSSKAFETRLAICDGAAEIDMVLAIGALKSGAYDYVLRDIEGVVQAAEGRAVKVILETAMLSPEEWRVASALSQAAGASFIKTSTGFGGGGAAVEDVLALRSIVGPQLGIKASGGIREPLQAKALVIAGADRIGTSVGPRLLQPGSFA